MGIFFGNSNEQDKSVEDLDKELEKVQREKLSKKGQRRLEQLKEEKKERIKEEKKELKKEEFRQTKAGKIIDRLGESLGNVAEASDNQKLENLSEAAEKVDGDGKKDTQSALGIGLEKESKQTGRDLEIEGDLEVEGDFVTNSDKKRSKKSKSEDPFSMESKRLFDE